ncbi:MAG: hypothetical protein ACRCXZ_02915 [Patescibacteria group bacterium]
MILDFDYKYNRPHYPEYWTIKDNQLGVAHDNPKRGLVCIGFSPITDYIVKTSEKVPYTMPYSIEYAKFSSQEIQYDLEAFVVRSNTPTATAKFSIRNIVLATNCSSVDFHRKKAIYKVKSFEIAVNGFIFVQPAFIRVDCAIDTAHCLGDPSVIREIDRYESYLRRVAETYPQPDIVNVAIQKTEDEIFELNLAKFLKRIGHRTKQFSILAQFYHQPDHSYYLQPAVDVLMNCDGFYKWQRKYRLGSNSEFAKLLKETIQKVNES